MSMHRITALTSLAVALALAACSQTPGVLIETASATDATTCSSGPSSPPLFHGQFDVNAGAEYWVDVLFRNRGGDFTLTDAVVALEDVDGDVMFTYRVPASAFVPAGTDAAPTEAGGAIQVIPAALTPTLQTMVPPWTTFDLVAHVTAYGTNDTGGREIAEEWLYPITVCDGCLCATPPPATSCHLGADGEGYAGVYACPPPP